MTLSEIASSRALPFGVYGAQAGQPGLGQNWRGKSDAYFRQRWSSTVFERAFTKTSTDDSGSLQIRRDGTDWILATARPFAGRNQRTRLVTRLAAGELLDWVLPVLRAMQAMPDELAYETAELALERPSELVDGQRDRLRKLLPYFRALERGAAENRLPLRARGTAIEPAGFPATFEDLALCAAFLLELVLPRVDKAAEPSATVLSGPIAMIEPSDLLQADFAAIFAQERAPTGADRSGATRRNTTSFALVADETPVRDVPLKELRELEPADFDALFADLRAGTGGWRLPLRCLPARLWTDAEREAIYRIWLSAPDLAWMRTAAADLARPGHEKWLFELGLLAAEVGHYEEIPVLEDLVPAELRAEILRLCRAEEPPST